MLKIRKKADHFGESERIQYLVVGVDPVDYVQQTSEMLKELQV
jgi:hypothetical protein